MTPKISIIVPVFNVKKYIDDCIKSIINQDFKDFELILIDDGSTDESGEICNKYAKNDERIRVIHKNNEGVSSARNLGINISRGKYISFVDSDDTINKKMYKKMYGLAIKENSEVVVCGYKEINYNIDKEYEFTNPLYGDNQLKGIEIKLKIEQLLYMNKILGYASLCNKLYKKEIIINNNLSINEEITIAEDLCFNMQLLLKINKISAINEPLYEYRRINNKSITSNTQNLYLKFKAREAMLNTFNNLNINKSVYLSCLKYENSTTVISYIGLIKNILSNNKRFITKINLLNDLLKERYLRNAIKNTDAKHFTFKTRSIFYLIRLYLFINRNGAKNEY